MLYTFILSIALIVIFYNIKRNTLVSSSTMWVICYMLIFLVCPLASGEDVYYTNKEQISFLACVGIFFFFIGLLIASGGNPNPYKKKKSFLIPSYRKANYMFWILVFIAFFSYIRMNGMTVMLNIISGVITSKEVSLNGDSMLNSYSMSVHLMMPCILILWTTAKNKSEIINKYICVIIYLTINVLFSFTRIFMIALLGIILFYELRNKKVKSQITIMSFSGFGLLLILVTMNFVRCYGIGEEITFEKIFNIEYILESSDFSGSYYWFDKLLSIDPPYISIDVYLKPIYAFIPRSIWENKPEPLSMQVLKIINPALAKAGYSTAGNSVIGEGYAILGYFGCVLFPFIWGYVCGKYDINYRRRLNIGLGACLGNLSYYIFSIFIIMSAQRGDWSQYMTIVLWLWILPIFLLSKRKRIKSEMINDYNT